MYNTQNDTEQEPSLLCHWCFPLISKYTNHAARITEPDRQTLPTSQMGGYNLQVGLGLECCWNISREGVCVSLIQLCGPNFVLHRLQISFFRGLGKMLSKESCRLIALSDFTDQLLVWKARDIRPLPGSSVITNTYNFDGSREYYHLQASNL